MVRVDRDDRPYRIFRAHRVFRGLEGLGFRAPQTCKSTCQSREDLWKEPCCRNMAFCSYMQDAGWTPSSFILVRPPEPSPKY